MSKFIASLGRMCFSIIFILSGIMGLLNWDATEASLTNAMLTTFNHFDQMGWAQSFFDFFIPRISTLFMVATVVQLVAGGLIFLGIQVRIGALLICLFLIPTTFLFHNFWLLEGSERELQTIMFLKNLAIFGGGLILLAQGNTNSEK